MDPNIKTQVRGVCSSPTILNRQWLHKLILVFKFKDNVIKRCASASRDLALQIISKVYGSLYIRSKDTYSKVPLNP